jgi:hypothetical protein
MERLRELCLEAFFFLAMLDKIEGRGAEGRKAKSATRGVNATWTVARRKETETQKAL